MDSVRRGFLQSFQNFHSFAQDLQQTRIRGLLDKLNDQNANKYYWIKSRLTTTWIDWQAAQAELKAKASLTSYNRKKVLLMGDIYIQFIWGQASSPSCLVLQPAILLKSLLLTQSLLK